MISEIPDKLDPTYLTKMNPPVGAAAEVARAVNKIIDYLHAIDTKIASLPDFSKPIE